MNHKKAISRRQFIKNSSAAAIGGSLFLGAPGIIFGQEEKTAAQTKVVLIRNKDVLDEKGTPRYEVVLEMLDTAVTTLTGKKDILEAWKTLIKPNDIVGIKTNVWKFIPTTKQVEDSLKKRVMDVGVAAANIAVDDRNVLNNPVFQNATALINARPMRSHHWSGVGSLIKNYIMFDPNPPSYHPDSCADLAKLWQLPIVKDKTRLNVLVMFTPQFHGVGPHNFNPQYVAKYYGLLVGFDPVAIDATGLRIIEAIRKEHFGEDRPLDPPAKHILLADTRHHLGTADPNKIDLIKLGYQEGILI
ncbi:MAG TPA: twin-arginine translocation signal domain-containing protein [Candidatus Deferrimicrobium sp.]|nr:twin-arginine translocation signal domain-containing protein [Candidatus Deferrimicrobium sp.]